MEHIRIIAPGDPGFDWLYDLYMQSFPVHEQRLRERQEGVLGHPEYHCDLLCQGETRVGLLMWWAGPGFRYVEHFCVRPELRGRRYGAKALEELGRKAKFSQHEISQEELTQFSMAVVAMEKQVKEKLTRWRRFRFKWFSCLDLPQ